MNLVQLGSDSKALLERVKEPVCLQALTSLDPAAAAQLAAQACEPYPAASGASQVLRQESRWFTRELARLMRGTPAGELATCVELLLQMWQRFGLPARMLELLLNAVCGRLLSGSAEAARQWMG